MFEYFFSTQLLAPEYFDWIWQGLLITIGISFCAIVFSSLLGFVVVAARDSHIVFLRWLAISYISLFRNTPLLIQLFFLVLCRRRNIAGISYAVAKYTTSAHYSRSSASMAII